MLTRIDTNELGFHSLMDQLWSGRTSALVPPMDAWEKDGILTVRATVPGVKQENLTIAVENGLLTIQGEVQKPESLGEARIYVHETTAGTYQRTLRLNGKFDTDRIEATLESGIVTITIPRAVSEQKRVIEVKIASNEN